ncbi:hypothetical protein ABK040_004781 [Willaertia magna]
MKNRSYTLGNSFLKMSENTTNGTGNLLIGKHIPIIRHILTFLSPNDIFFNICCDVTDVNNNCSFPSSSFIILPLNLINKTWNEIISSEVFCKFYYQENFVPKDQTPFSLFSNEDIEFYNEFFTTDQYYLKYPKYLSPILYYGEILQCGFQMFCKEKKDENLSENELKIIYDALPPETKNEFQNKGINENKKLQAQVKSNNYKINLFKYLLSINGNTSSINYLTGEEKKEKDEEQEEEEEIENEENVNANNGGEETTNNVDEYEQEEEDVTLEKNSIDIIPIEELQENFYKNLLKFRAKLILRHSPQYLVYLSSQLLHSQQYTNNNAFSDTFLSQMEKINSVSTLHENLIGDMNRRMNLLNNLFSELKEVNKYKEYLKKWKLQRAFPIYNINNNCNPFNYFFITSEKFDDMTLVIFKDNGEPMKITLESSKVNYYIETVEKDILLNDIDLFLYISKEININEEELQEEKENSEDNEEDKIYREDFPFHFLSINPKDNIEISYFHNLFFKLFKDSFESNF